ncbi:MAG: hypothetical protein ABIR71_08805 [Chthoniobacterales bacterium]
MTGIHALTAVSILLCLFALPSEANLGAFSASEIQRTGNLVPIQASAIRIEKETLNVRLEAETASVSVDYQFINSGPDDEVIVAFPVDLMPPPGDNTTYNVEHWQKDGLQDFCIFDGRDRVPVQRTVEEPQTPSDPTKKAKDVSLVRRWLVASLHFGRGEQKSVRVTYTVRCLGVDTGLERDPKMEFTPRTFLYTFRPARSWGNGRVGRMDIVMDARFLHRNRFEILEIKPKPRTNNAGVLHWSYKDLDLNRASDLLCTYDPLPALFQQRASSVLLKENF